MMRMRVWFVSVAGMLAVVSCLAACGGSSGTHGVATSSAKSQTTATVSDQTPVSKQEIVKATGCLKRERVRPARHAPNRQEVPHGANEMTRNGLPMTPQEYEATVRRCLTSTKSASASTRRK
jgi:hypothetical protein